MLSNLFLGANSAIAVCYFAIAFLIWRGLKRGQQHLLNNPLVVATAAIFFTCALGHSAHILVMAGEQHNSLSFMGIQVVFDLLTAVVAVTYLALRRHYSLLIDGPLLLAQTQNKLMVANEKLAKVNATLEHLVAERTNELQQTNQQLNREIAERQEVEKALRKAYEELEIRVQERTIELSAANLHLQQQITERLQAESALSKSESTLRSFFDSASMMMGIVDLVGDDILHISHNAATTEFFGFSPEQMQQRLASEMGVPQEYIREWVARYRQTKRTKAPVSFEYPHNSGDGQKWLRATVCSIPVSAGNLPRFAYIVEDFTDRKVAESQIRTLNNELEQRVIERTAQLAAANQLKDELLVREQTARASVTNILESISDAFYTLDNEWQFTYINPKAAQLMQRSLEELLGKNVWQEFPEAKGSTFDREYHRALAQKVTVRFEEFYPPLNLWIEARAYPAANGLSVYFQDITGRKQTEAALRQSDRRYRSLVFATAQNVWTTSAQGEVVGDLPMWRAITGQTEAEIQGWGWLEALHPDDRDSTAKLWMDALETKSLFETEYRVRRYDGSYGYFTVRGVPIVSADGSIQEWVGIHNDISDRFLAEQALQESDSILRAVIEGTTDAIFMKDLQGRYVILNSATAKIIGKPVEEIVGKNDTEILPIEVGKQIEEIDRRIITSNTSEVVEEIVPMQGELRTFFTAKTVCRNEQGKVIGLIGIARDISDRKRIEEQIKELNQDLERRVEERTAQLEVANKELEAFSYSVSHDLRAPLRSIDGFSLALLESYGEQLDGKGKHYLQRVRNASQRMGELIDDLLHLSRVTRSEMHFQTVDLSEIVQAIAADLQHAQPERSVDFIIASGVVVQGDSRLLKIVFENLLNNAWKFTSKKLYSTIEFGTSPQPDSTTVYFVRDNGAGFDMAYANNLFGAFQRLHTIDEFPGSGIGLATVKRIIHRHGGIIWAEGAIDQGATFYFTLQN